jgi:hypothetical protein
VLERWQAPALAHGSASKPRAHECNPPRLYRKSPRRKRFCKGMCNALCVYLDCYRFYRPIAPPRIVRHSTHSLQLPMVCPEPCGGPAVRQQVIELLDRALSDPREHVPVRHGQLRSFLGGAPKHTDLVSKRQDLHLESGLRTEDREHCRKEQTQDAQHRVSQSLQDFGKPNDLRKIEVSENHSSA